MADIRALARISGHSTINESGAFMLSQSEMFRLLSGELGISFDAIVRKFTDYHFDSIAILSGTFLKVSFTHTRYGIGKHRDKILTDTVSIVWERDADANQWVQLGVNRTPIESRTHFHTDRAYDSAVDSLKVDAMVDSLTEQLAK